jgi:CO dehydrogenase maturation factor
MARVIAVTGKGGTGKTVVAALMVEHLKAGARGPILALDADPDANLGTLLGIGVPQTIGGLREDVLQQIKNLPSGMSKEAYVETGLHELIAEDKKVDLVTMGRGEGPGCYCFVNLVLRKFADSLGPSYEWIVMDNEAGLEHLSRRTTSRIDALVVVVNDNPLSTDCARRIDDLLAGLGRDVAHRYFIVNAARPDREAAVRERMAGLSQRYLCTIPHDAALEEAVFAGRPVGTLGDTPAVTAVRDAMSKIGAG